MRLPLQIGLAYEFVPTNNKEILAVDAVLREL
jgi:hypothetical protein